MGVLVYGVEYAIFLLCGFSSGSIIWSLLCEGSGFPLRGYKVNYEVFYEGFSQALGRARTGLGGFGLCGVFVALGFCGFDVRNVWGFVACGFWKFDV